MISLILPVFLGKYPNSAKDLGTKFYRCLDMIEAQTVKDFELVIVADGCPNALDIVKDHGIDATTISIPKQGLYSGVPRNIGIQEASGEWITYIDADDILGKDHIKILSDQLTKDWHWFNDYSYDTNTKSFKERTCLLSKGQCGTSNIIHKKSLNVKWGDGYLHDWNIIQDLMKFGSYSKIETPQYYVCHIPNRYDI